MFDVNVDGPRSLTTNELDATIAKVVASPVLVVAPVEAVKVKRVATSSDIARRAGHKLARLAASERVQDSYVATFTVQTESATTVLGEMTVAGESLQVATPRMQRKLARTPKRQSRVTVDPRYRQGSGIESDVLRRYEYDTHVIEPQSADEAQALIALAGKATRKAKRAQYQARLHATQAVPTGERTPVAGGSYHHASLTLRS